MAIGAAWDISDPAKPWALWDDDANIVIPIGVLDWLAEIGTTYGSHTVTAVSPLQCADPGTYSGGTIGVRMKLAAGAAFTAGKKYPFTIRIIGADAITQDERTLWLKVKER